MTSVAPVVLIIFKRPDLTTQVFKAIRQVKPQKLFIIADGSRTPEEEVLCEQTRAITEDIDWECDVQRNYSVSNLGCKQRVVSGLDWVFEQVEEAIILEDDCLPSPSFFSFCSELLEEYRSDPRIFMIGGSNFQDGYSRTPYSYFFSKYTLIWGWATWKRAWKHFDLDLQTWDDEIAHKVIRSVCHDEIEREIRFTRYQQIKSGTLKAWSPSWLFSCWGQNGLTILPDKNLISNIGFDDRATHTKFSEFRYGNLQCEDIFELHHPKYIFRNEEADNYMFEQFFGGARIRESRKLKNRVRKYFRQQKQKVRRFLADQSQ